jgi:hypoxanthine phosphoribosyltransferase
MARLRVLIPAEEIARRVMELGAQITQDYAGSDRPLYLVGVLKGSFMFVADLARQIPGRVRLDFIGVASYGKAKASSGEAKLTKDLDSSIEGCDVILVEDVADTGITLSYLLDLLRQRRPRSLRVAALLDKPSRRVRDITVDYVAFTIPDEFVVGYGLDYAQDHRNLPDVCVLEE